MANLGLKHIREGINPNFDQPAATFSRRLYDLYGIDFIEVIAQGQTATTNWLPYKQIMGPAWTSFEGQNEPCGGQATASCAPGVLAIQQTASAAATTDSRFAGMTMVGPSWISCAGSAGYGDQRQYADVANMHRYFSGRNPTTLGWYSSQVCGALGGGMQSNWNTVEQAYPPETTPAYTTETGYCSQIAGSTDPGFANCTPEEVNAAYTPQLFVYDWKWTNGVAGIADGQLIPRTYIYQLAADGTDIYNHTFGLADTNFTPKPMYYAVQGFLAHLADAPTAARLVPYTLTNTTSHVWSLALSYSNGDNGLILYSDASLWTPQNTAPPWGTLTRQSPINVTVTLPAVTKLTIASQAPITGVWSDATQAPATQFVVPVTQEMKIVRWTPAVAPPSPSPGPSASPSPSPSSSPISTGYTNTNLPPIGWSPLVTHGPAIAPDAAHINWLAACAVATPVITCAGGEPLAIVNSPQIIAQTFPASSAGVMGWCTTAGYTATSGGHPGSSTCQGKDTMSGVFFASNSDPLYKITCVTYACGYGIGSGGTGTDSLSGESVHIANGSIPNLGGDAHLTIFNEQAGTTCQFWNTENAAGHPDALSGGGNLNVGDGSCGALDANTDGTGRFIAYASGVEMSRFLVRPEELLAGHITHALYLSVSNNAPRTHAWPASSTDGTCSGSNLGVQGMVYYLSTAGYNRLMASNASAIKKTMLRVYHEYGVFDFDSSGCGSPSANYSNFLGWDPLLYTQTGQTSPWATVLAGLPASDVSASGDYRLMSLSLAGTNLTAADFSVLPLGAAQCVVTGVACGAPSPPPAPSPSPSPPAGPTMAGVSSGAVQQSIGFCTHLSRGDYGGTWNGFSRQTFFEQALIRPHIYHVREDYLNIWNGGTIAHNLVAGGVHFDLVAVQQSTTAAQITAGVQAFPKGSVESIEGPNECDINKNYGCAKDTVHGGPYPIYSNNLMAYQKNVMWPTYVALKNGGYIKDVIAPSPGQAFNSPQFGNMSAYITKTNLHYYSTPQWPERPNNLQSYMAQVNTIGPGLPMVITETATTMFGPATDPEKVAGDIAGRNSPRKVFDSWIKGARGIFFYALTDWQPFGYIANQNYTEMGAPITAYTMRPEYKGVAGLSELMYDPTPTSGPCTVGANVTGTGVHVMSAASSGVMVFNTCKSSGERDIFLWQPLQNFSTTQASSTTGTYVNPVFPYALPAVNVNVSINGGLPVRLYTQDPTTGIFSMTDPNPNLNALPVTDSVEMLQIGNYPQITANYFPVPINL